MGRPAYKATDKQRAEVVLRVTRGETHQQISESLNIDKHTLHKYFKPELVDAGRRLNQLIGGTLAAKALSGDVTSCIFWLKCKAGFREKGSEYSQQQGGRVTYGWSDDVDAAATQQAKTKPSKPTEQQQTEPVVDAPVGMRPN
jgi:hypothetical protein